MCNDYKYHTSFTYNMRKDICVTVEAETTVQVHVMETKQQYYTLLFTINTTDMKNILWVSTHKNKWWRNHKPWDIRVDIENQTKEESIKKARKIAERTRQEIGKLPYKPDWRKYAWINPFPPRYYNH